VPQASRSDGIAALDAVGATWMISGRGSDVTDAELGTRGVSGL
jgi:hypothetical protein